MAKSVKETTEAPKPAFGDRVIRLSLVPTSGHDGTVVKLIKDFPRTPWSDVVYEDWGLVIDEGEQEHPIAAITINLIQQRQEINLAPVETKDMPASLDKYTKLGWVAENGR